MDQFQLDIGHWDDTWYTQFHWYSPIQIITLPCLKLICFLDIKNVVEVFPTHIAHKPTLTNFLKCLGAIVSTNIHLDFFQQYLWHKFVQFGCSSRCFWGIICNMHLLGCAQIKSVKEHYFTLNWNNDWQTFIQDSNWRLTKKHCWFHQKSFRNSN